ncbi:hypothetical protein [Streptomyces seoulensis]
MQLRPGADESRPLPVGLGPGGHVAPAQRGQEEREHQGRYDE